MKIVIIEDEHLTAKDLAKTIKALDSDFEILSMISSVEEGIDYFTEPHEVDLIFSDIELGDGLSFKIFEKVNNQIPVIFCTAYNQYALDAFNSSGIDYILKPFDKNSINKAISKFIKLKERLVQTKIDYSDIIKLLENQIQTPKAGSVIIHQADKIIPLEVSKVALFYTENTYTFALTFDGKEHLLSENLETLERSFTGSFFRANRQFLVNRKAVKDASHFFNRKIVLNLTIAFKEQIIVGKLKTTAFVKWLATS